MRKLLLSISVMLAAWSLSGCGGGSSSSSSGDALSNGRSALNRVVSGAAAADTTTFQSIVSDFRKAIEQNPGSLEARFGLAVCLAGEAGIGLDGSGDVTGNADVPSATSGSGGSLPAPPTTGEVPPAPPGMGSAVHPVRPRYILSRIWYLTGGLSNPYVLLNMLAPVADLKRGLLPYYGYSQDSSDVARRQDLLTKLNTVSDQLKTIESDPTFATTLPDPYQTTKTVAVGLPEVYLFDAYVQSLRVEIALSLAYVRDPGGFQFIPTPLATAANGAARINAPLFAVGAASGFNPTSIYTALDQNGDGRLTPAEYLPPDPYLTLRDASYLSTAQQGLLAVVDRATKGISGVFARPADAAFLVSNTDDTQQALSETRDHVLPLIQQAASGPVELDFPRYLAPGNASQAADPPPPAPGTGGVFAVPGSGGPPAPPVYLTDKVTVNLAAWFTAPPADLKRLAPTYQLDAQGNPDRSKTAYVDPTFAGLFPKGLPNDLLF